MGEEEKIVWRNHCIEWVDTFLEQGIMPQVINPLAVKENYIQKDRLILFLKRRLRKYQDADDGKYQQEYLTRGELELVDRYKECGEILEAISRGELNG